MTELQQGLLATAGLLPSLIFGLLSMFGGRKLYTLGIRPRIWKRLIAPFSFVALTILYARIAGHQNPLYVIAFVTYFVSCFRGYGGESLEEKLLNRTIWSLVRTSASLAFCVFSGAWTLFFLQMAVGWVATLILGIFNPLKAAQEENLINFTSVMFVPFMV